MWQKFTGVEQLRLEQLHAMSVLVAVLAVGVVFGRVVFFVVGVRVLVLILVNLWELFSERFGEVAKDVGGVVELDYVVGRRQPSPFAVAVGGGVVVVIVG